MAEVVDRYFRSLDERDFDVEHQEALLLPDVRILRPNGTALVGIERMCNSYRSSFERFERTQHLLTGHEVEIDGETATIRVDLVAVHAWRPDTSGGPEGLFVAGAVITGVLRRVEGRWKIALLDNTNVWRSGAGFNEMERTDRS